MLLQVGATNREALSVADLMVRLGLTTSLHEGRRLAAQGGVAVDGERVTDGDAVLAVAGRWVTVRVGKAKPVTAYFERSE